MFVAPTPIRVGEPAEMRPRLTWDVTAFTALSWLMNGRPTGAPVAKSHTHRLIAAGDDHGPTLQLRRAHRPHPAVHANRQDHHRDPARHPLRPQYMTTTGGPLTPGR
jgi:hypothetical protein